MVGDPHSKPDSRAPLVALVNPQIITSSWGRGLRPGTMEDALPRHGLTHLSACLKERGHRVLLVDLRLLRGWGEYESLLAREVRKIRPSLPIILISGFSDPSTIHQAHELGIVSFVAKPFSQETIGTAVYGALHPGQVR